MLTKNVLHTYKIECPEGPWVDKLGILGTKTSLFLSSDCEESKSDLKEIAKATTKEDEFKELFICL